MKKVFTLNGVVVGHVTAHAAGVVVACSIAESTNYEVPDTMQVDAGWTVAVIDGAPVFTAPAPVLPTVDIPTFMNLFTLDEQMAIEGSTDPRVITMWKRFSDPRVQSVNLNLASIQGALEYLSIAMQLPAVTPPAPYILPARIAQINTGTPQ